MSMPVTYHRNGNIGVITIDNPPVNALSTAVRQGLMEALGKGQADDQCQAIVVIGSGRTFPAGADIKEFNQPPQQPALPDVVNALENSRKPVIVAIHGTALGGGMEITLGCDYRIAEQQARMGLPEINLGLLPGAGGTQRLPRLIGARAALDIILGGKPVTASRMLELGVIDRLTSQDLTEAALAYAREIVADGASVRPIGQPGPAEPDDDAIRDYKAFIARKKRGYEAPPAIIEAVQAATEMNLMDGLARERALFIELRASAQAAAQRHIFFAERSASKVPGVSKDTPAQNITRAAVIGAGTMGSGIAISLLDAGIQVMVVEQDDQALARGHDKIKRHYQSQVDKARIDATTRDRRLAQLSTASDYQAVANADLIIEAVFEDLQIKQEVFAKLDRHVRADTILATNTSTLDVSAIAAQTRRPEQVVGLHFFSPAHIMPLVEIVRTPRTSDAVVASATKLIKRLGKIGVVVGICYGFVGNRILHKRQAQAVDLVSEGATPTRVDQVIYDFGMPMGPFAMWDMAGLDISYRAREAVRARDPDNAPPRSWLDDLVEAGRLGQKTEGGVFDYEGRRPVPADDTAHYIDAFRQRNGLTPRSITDGEIRERCLYMMINEACRILDEGIATRPSDIDVVWVNGYGFPRYHGGPMYWADQVGPARILDRVRDFHQATGNPDWSPAPLLVKLATENRSFTSLN